MVEAACQLSVCVSANKVAVTGWYDAPRLGRRLGLVAGLALGRDQYCTGSSLSERGTPMAWSIRSARLASASLRLAI
jgi:hypothetical protein